jgi:hypothetical protein
MNIHDFDCFKIRELETLKREKSEKSRGRNPSPGMFLKKKKEREC